MRRSRFVLFLTIALVLAAAMPVGAKAFKWRINEFGGGNSPLVFSGIAVGLGNEVFTVVVEGTASVVALCENQGGTRAQGRNALTTTVSNSAMLDTDSNGTVSVGIVVAEPTEASFGDQSPSVKEAGCPSGKWEIVGFMLVEWVAAQVTVTDSFGTVVFDQAYDCSGGGAILKIECTEAA